MPGEPHAHLADGEHPFYAVEVAEASGHRWYVAPDVKPRDLAINPRCPDCQSPDPNGRPPMFHPAHPWGPCWVRLPDGELCPHREPTAEAR